MTARICVGALGSLLALGTPEAHAQPAPSAAQSCESPIESPRSPNAAAAAQSTEEPTGTLPEGDLAAALSGYRAARRDAEAQGFEREALKARADELRVAVELHTRRPGAFEASVPGPTELEAEIRQAFQRCGALESDEESVRLRIHLGRTAQSLSVSGAEAASAAALAAGIWQEASKTAAEIGDRRQQSYALGYLSELYRDHARFEEALGMADRALFAAQQSDALEATARWRARRAELLLELGREPEALVAFREAVETLGRLRAETGSRFVANVVDQSVYRSLVDLLLRAAADTPDPNGVQVLLSEARDVLEDQKAEELREYFSDPCLAVREGTLSDDVPGALVVYPISLPDRLELIVSGHGKLERFRSDVGRQALEAEVKAFRQALQRRTSRQYLRHARQLHAWLVEPIDALLEAESPEAVVFVPGGALRTIPFAALQRASDRLFLIERYPVAVIPSLSLVEPQPIEREQVRLLAAGLTVGVQGYPALEHVRQELESLATHFQTTTILDDEFETERIEREIKTVPYDIIHLASHGEFNGNPDESFLLTHDGRISMNDLSAWIAATRFRADDPLELLTLSACETAVGDERAALGLAGVAVQAGARSVLATLWSVNDEATALIIDGFYERLGTPNVSRAQALQIAQRSLIATAEYRHPAYWAAFLLLNNWQ